MEAAKQRAEADSVQLPETTKTRLEELRHHVRFIKIAEGVCAGLFGLAISYLAVFVLDRFIDTPALLRGIFLLVGTVGFGVILPWKCHRWVWGTRRMEQVARMVKYKYPRLGDQLLGVVELARNEKELQGSVALAHAAISQIDDVVKDRDLKDAVPNPKHKFWAGTAGIPVAVMVAIILLLPAAGKNALARWLFPWQDVERYTFTQIESLPEKMIVPHGEEFTISALLKESTRNQPEQGSVSLPGSSQPITASLDSGSYNFLIPPQTSQFPLHISIGDVKETIQIQAETRPELEAMQATIHLPAYLQYTHPLKTDVRGGVISILENSVAQFEATINRNLQMASVEGHQATVTKNRIATEAISVTKTEPLLFHWQDELGLSSKDAFPLKINAVEDVIPNISARLEEQVQVILLTDVIRFDLQADDDFGLKKIGLEWQGVVDPLRNPFPESGEKVVLQGAPEKQKLQATATFSAESDHVKPQTIRLRAYAEDYNPTQKRAYSSVVLLHVMTPAEHAIWITNQLRRWASLADDVYEEEVRLHDENREIRRMDPAKRNLPNAQRRIEQQAASERANADRLDAVADQGDKLIEQALKNPEMLAGHLETWANALKQLRGISEEKMPSVADLLAKAARNNSGKPSAGKPGDGKSTEGKPSQGDPKEGKPGDGKSGESDPNGKNKKPSEPSEGESSSQKANPKAGNDKSEKSGKGGGKTEPAKPKPTVPSLQDVESGFNKIPEKKPDDTKKKPGQGKLTLPTTTLNGGPQPKEDPNQEGDEEQEDPVDDAVEEQEDLLEEFAKVRGDLQAILDDLENSTFVKRLKAASRRQMEVTKDLNRTLFKGFGIKEEELNDRQADRMEKIAGSEIAQSKNLWTIQSDLEAYYGRKREEKMLDILKEMEETEAVFKLNALGDHIIGNLSGESISRAEFWADTLDRWAEELVEPSKAGKCKGGGKSDSLPPEIILEVMRILDGEIDLRDETRSLEQAKSAIKKEKFETQAAKQVETQDELVERTQKVIEDILAIPEGNQKFGKELKAIAGAKAAMEDASHILSRPSTGPAAIAAETEAIELLLQSKRANPNGGGGGGGSTPGGGGSGTTDQSALTLHGPGSDPHAHIEDRATEQNNGVTNGQLPEEFRDGLDAFFNALDRRK